MSSKAHKDKVAFAKKLKSQPIEPATTGVSKRPSTFSEPQVQKKVKGILKNAEPIPANVKASLPADFFEKPSCLSSSIPKTNLKNDSISNNVEKLNLDDKEIKEKDSTEGKEKDSKGSQSAIPEGFFDDPEMDAKVIFFHNFFYLMTFVFLDHITLICKKKKLLQARNVEYKNPKEEEWEKFLKEIKEEEVQSAQIIEEDLEEVAKERQLEVVDEQLRCWSNFMNLVEKKELLQQKKKEVKIFDKCESSSSDDDESDDSEDANEWRKKKVV